MAILEDLVDVEKSILGAVSALADTASEAVVNTLKAAADSVRAVIETVGGSEDASQL